MREGIVASNSIQVVNNFLRARKIFFYHTHIYTRYKFLYYFIYIERHSV